MNIGDQVRARAEEIDRELPTLETEMESLIERVREMRRERRGLGRVIRQLDGATGPAVTDEQVLEAVHALGGEDICGMAVAQHLGVSLRNVARKLRKHVDDGKLTGDPIDGYTAVAK